MNSITDLLQQLDNEISEYKKVLTALEEKYKIKNGEIEEKLFEEFSQHQQAEKEKFETKVLATEKKLEETCRALREQQPLLPALTLDDANTDHGLPEEIILGKLRVKFNNYDNKVPETIPFPVEKPLYFDNVEDNALSHKLLLRLLYALPLTKCQFTVYDPKSFGISAQDFVPLASVEKVVPCQEFLTEERAFKEQLEHLLKAATEMIQTKFPNCSRNCRTWLDYNQEMQKRGEYQKMLPYHVILVYNIDPSTNSEVMRYLENLINLGTKCGLLVVFSYDKQSFEEQKGEHNERSLQRIERFIAQAQPLKSFYGNLLPKLNLVNLQISEESEPYPDVIQISNIIYNFKGLIDNTNDKVITFKDLINIDKAKTRYNEFSTERIKVPLGMAAGNIAKLDIGDKHVHALIGGQTGSGKSNLLHNIILNACWNYSPDELNLYLLDLKDGVEFNIYAKPELPHAKLVATAADTEYGASVIEFLVQEKVRRNDLFKRKSVGNTKITNYLDYRKNFNGEKLPRIILVVDEFQVLFEGRNAERNKEAIKMLARQGRSVGIHMIFATQALKGIFGFRDIISEFGTRIVLKCDANISNMLLGERGNYAAVKLEDYHGIYNNNSGEITNNVDFAIPYADPTLMHEVICIMHENWKEQGREITTKIFEGQTLPLFPTADFFAFTGNSGTTLKLGEEFNFESAPLTVKFGDLEDDNLFVIGSDANFKQGLLHSVLLSANGNEVIKEIIYVGEGDSVGLQAYQKKEGMKPVVVYANASEFVNATKDKFGNCGRIVIFDKCALKKELKGYSSLGINTNLKDEALLLEQYFENKKRTQNYVVAFYDRYDSLKNSGLDYKNLFAHRICFGLSADDINKNFSNIHIKLQTNIANRALYFTANGDAYTWFRPYVFPKEE